MKERIKYLKQKMKKIICINSEDIDNNLIKQYWYLIQNKNIDIVHFKKMFKKIDKLINLSKDNNNLFLLFKKIESIKNKKYSNIFLDLFIILNNYNQFMKTNNFDKNRYLRIIFKELFSLIDKIIFEKCLYFSLKKINFDKKIIKNNIDLKYLIFTK